jgi:hypothetical protein
MVRTDDTPSRALNCRVVDASMYWCTIVTTMLSTIPSTIPSTSLPTHYSIIPTYSSAIFSLFFIPGAFCDLSGIRDRERQKDQQSIGRHGSYQSASLRIYINILQVLLDYPFSNPFILSPSFDYPSSSEHWSVLSSCFTCLH